MVDEATPEVAPEEKVKSAMEMLNAVDSKGTASRKFKSGLLVQVTWKALLAYGIYLDLDSTVLLSMIAAASAAESIWQGGQVWHDKHVKTAKLDAIASNGKGEPTPYEGPFAHPEEL